MKLKHFILLPAFLLSACASTPREDPTAPGAPMIQLGRQMLERGEVAAAQNFFMHALEKDPKNFTAQKEMAGTLRRSGNLDSARIYYEAVLEAAPRDAAARRDYGRLLLQLGEVEAARRQLKRAVELNADDAKARAAYGLALDQAGQHKDAQKEYLNALRVEPDNLSTLNNLAYSYLLTQQPQEAIKLLEPRQDAPSAPPSLRKNLALAYGLAGMELDAERVLKRDHGLEETRQRLAFYRSQRAAMGQNAAPVAILGSYATYAVAETALQQLASKVAAKDPAAKLGIATIIDISGGTPRFQLNLTREGNDKALAELCSSLPDCHIDDSIN